MWRLCKTLDENGFEENRTIIWARKRGFNNTRGKALASGYEPILFWSNGKSNTFNNIKLKVKSDRPEYNTGTLKDGITMPDVWTDIPALPHNAKEKVDHPTQKPIKLMERLVELFTNENDIILDFCMGSGSTGVACLNLNRSFIGIEKDEQYFYIAKNRLNLYCHGNRTRCQRSKEDA
jgi:site-specific DNA-methyltransferase (adenine-specific)